MVLLSCSGTGCGIYAKLANGGVERNCARDSPTHNSVARHCVIEGLQRDNSIGSVNGLRCYDLLRVVNQRIIANALVERSRPLESKIFEFWSNHRPLGDYYLVTSELANIRPGLGKNAKTA